jgi:hypothetical protein
VPTGDQFMHQIRADEPRSAGHKTIHFAQT